MTPENKDPSVCKYRFDHNETEHGNKAYCVECMKITKLLKENGLTGFNAMMIQGQNRDCLGKKGFCHFDGGSGYEPAKACKQCGNICDHNKKYCHDCLNKHWHKHGKYPDDMKA